MQSFSFIHQMFYNYDVFDESIWFKLEKYIYSKTKCNNIWQIKKKENVVESPLHTKPPPEKSEAKCETLEKPQIAVPIAIAVPIPVAEAKLPLPLAKPRSAGGEPLKENTRDRMFEPSYTNDTIFWCIFQYVYGERELEIIKGKTAIRMMEEKQKIMKWLQEHPKTMKSSNVKFTNDRISSVISEFMCAKGESSFLMIAAYAMYYKIRIYLVDEKRKTYLRFFPEFDSELDDSFCILYKNPRSKSASAKYHCRFRNGCEQNEKEEFEELFNTKCELVQYDKPLNGQTQYGVSDLEIMATKLGIQLEDENSKRVKKGDLYKKIWDKMEWQM